MKFNMNREDKVLTVTVEGEVNTLNAGDLQDALAEAVRPDDTVVFVLDRLTYISSAGLRCFAYADHATGSNGSVVIRGVREEVLSILQMTGFDQVLTIE